MNLVVKVAEYISKRTLKPLSSVSLRVFSRNYESLVFLFSKSLSPSSRISISS